MSQFSRIYQIIKSVIRFDTLTEAINVPRRRIESLDILRGGAIIGVITVHIMFGAGRSVDGMSNGTSVAEFLYAALAMFMIISKYGFTDLALADGSLYAGTRGADPARIAAQVVSGIGFLGAGAIIQMKGSVRGLTTAAGIWISACIGLAVGAGMYLVSLIATLLIIFILVNIERIEQRANMLWETKVIRIKVGEIVTDRDACKAVFKQHKLHAIVESMKYDYENNTSIINYRVLTRKSTDIASLFDELKAQYDKTLSISLTNEANL